MTKKEAKTVTKGGTIYYKGNPEMKEINKMRYDLFTELGKYKNYEKYCKQLDEYNMIFKVVIENDFMLGVYINDMAFIHITLVDINNLSIFAYCIIEFMIYLIYYNKRISEEKKELWTLKN